MVFQFEWLLRGDSLRRLMEGLVTHASDVTFRLRKGHVSVTSVTPHFLLYHSNTIQEKLGKVEKLTIQPENAEILLDLELSLLLQVLRQLRSQADILHFSGNEEDLLKHHRVRVFHRQAKAEHTFSLPLLALDESKNLGKPITLPRGICMFRVGYDVLETTLKRHAPTERFTTVTTDGGFIGFHSEGKLNLKTELKNSSIKLGFNTTGDEVAAIPGLKGRYQVKNLKALLRVFSPKHSVDMGVYNEALYFFQHVDDTHTLLKILPTQAPAKRARKGGPPGRKKAKLFKKTT